ncbi:histidine phosphatase family protein [Dactylosporangium sp. NPDC000555]|uniref:histidine phosphatase family protein n=1 Tax=Dactylosporangium sp. NPDC000555 TaxID=3154260 RepID=UPI003320B331
MGDLVAALTVIRHGQSTANVAFAAAEAAGLLESGVAGRDADVELSALGRAQAETLGRWLAGLPARRRPERVLCSPYLRARQTWRIAAETAAGLDAKLPDEILDDRLGDRLMGQLELLTTAAIAARFPAEAARRRMDGEFGYRPPGGESFGDIAARLSAVLRDINDLHAGRRVTLVAHDAVVLMTRYVVEELSFQELATIVRAGAVANGSITEFDGSSGRLRLAKYNVVDHLTDHKN